MDKMCIYNDVPSIHTQYVQQKNGIPKERIINYNDILIIEDLVKCSICLEDYKVIGIHVGEDKEEKSFGTSR